MPNLLLRSGAPVFALLCGGMLHAQTLFAPPQVPAGNPITAQKALLGKALFWDEQLSSSRTVACATCHVLGSGGSDPRALSAVNPGPDGVIGTPDDVHGSFGVVRQDASGHFVPSTNFGIRTQVTPRKAPSVINAAYHVNQFWDGRATTTFVDPVSSAVVLPTYAALESQAAGPPVSEGEMSHIGRTWTDIANDLPGLQPLALADQIPAALQTFVTGQTYATLFSQAFGSPGVTPARIIMAIATYERTLISDQSPYDLFLAGQGSLSPLETQGLTVFNALCAACHADVDATVLTTGPVLNDYRNIGVRPNAEDVGRFAVTGNPTDQGTFKVPGLRNVALRAPYFHNGELASLGDVIDFYARGGDFHVNQDPLILNIPGQVSISSRLNLIQFLQTLTDPRVQNETPPFDRPHLWSESNRVPSVFGTGTVGGAGLSPRSVALMPPFTGNTKFTLGVDQTAPGVFHMLAWDIAANPTPTVLLGQNIYLANTAQLSLTGFGATQGTGAGGGWSSATFTIPPGLQGLSFFGQWVVMDPQGPNGLTVSDAFGLTVF